MRTLLTNSLPPQYVDEQLSASGAGSSAGLAETFSRTFFEGAVLALLDDLVEVEAGEMVIATSSALHAEQADAALERGVASFSQITPQADDSSGNRQRKS